MLPPWLHSHNFPVTRRPGSLHHGALQSISFHKWITKVVLPNHLWVINPAAEILLNVHQNILLPFWAPRKLYSSPFKNLNRAMWWVLPNRMCKEVTQTNSRPAPKVSSRITHTLSFSLADWVQSCQWRNPRRPCRRAEHWWKETESQFMKEEIDYTGLHLN